MAIQFASQTVSNGNSHTFIFEKKLISATAFVQGYQLSYPNSDNHLKKANVKCEITNINENKVTVKAISEGNDSSSNKATGTINITCVAEM
ncbi:hypothetical protein [Paenibacillus sp. ISL-20]|uniref:hypothetical protein n=1 Tax=Paenibacillus sp. ISL-20 TaxID=2819163 RepID=UPI001BE6C518|nr:hypothetical protein [Paenibacillus sp. ISL-20]MBT2765565.1 hypothetical protein [Paenibacillus sp. ISL-20]